MKLYSSVFQAWLVVACVGGGLGRLWLFCSFCLVFLIVVVGVQVAVIQFLECFFEFEIFFVCQVVCQVVIQELRVIIGLFLGSRRDRVLVSVFAGFRIQEVEGVFLRYTEFRRFCLGVDFQFLVTSFWFGFVVRIFFRAVFYTVVRGFQEFCGVICGGFIFFRLKYVFRKQIEYFLVGVVVDNEVIVLQFFLYLKIVLVVRLFWIRIIFSLGKVGQQVYKASDVYFVFFSYILLWRQCF